MIGKVSSQNNCCSKLELSEKDSIITLLIKDNALDSIINTIENEFLSAKNPQSWQVVELNMIQKEENIFFQFTGFVYIPDALKMTSYKGGFFKGDRLYIVKSKNEEVFADFFSQKEKTKLLLRKHIPFIMENPIWLFSYNKKNKFKLEKVINEKVMTEI